METATAQPKCCCLCPTPPNVKGDTMKARLPSTAISATQSPSIGCCYGAIMALSGSGHADPEHINQIRRFKEMHNINIDKLHLIKQTFKNQLIARVNKRLHLCFTQDEYLFFILRIPLFRFWN